VSAPQLSYVLVSLLRCSSSTHGPRAARWWTPGPGGAMPVSCLTPTQQLSTAHSPPLARQITEPSPLSETLTCISCNTRLGKHFPLAQYPSRASPACAPFPCPWCRSGACGASCGSVQGMVSMREPESPPRPASSSAGSTAPCTGPTCKEGGQGEAAPRDYPGSTPYAPRWGACSAMINVPCWYCSLVSPSLLVSFPCPRCLVACRRGGQRRCTGGEIHSSY